MLSRSRPISECTTIIYLPLDNAVHVYVFGFSWKKSDNKDTLIYKLDYTIR